VKPLAGATTARQPYQRYLTIEDTETTRSEIEAEFGPAIAAAVAEVTDDKSLPNVRDVASSPRPLIGRSSGNTNTSIGRARSWNECYSTFWICSRICSITTFISTAARVVSASCDFEDRVLASRLSSCIRKSSRRPAASLPSSALRISTT
jgi:hypothetical protein